MQIPNDTLKKILVNAGYLSEEDFNSAAESAQDLGKKIDDILIFRGLINEDTLGKLIAAYIGFPFVIVSRKTVPDELLNLIPEKLARMYHIVPFEKEGQNLKVAMDDPGNFEAVEFTKRQTGLQITPYFARTDDIQKALGQYKRNIRTEFEKIISTNIQETKSQQEENLAIAAERLPTIKILDTILTYAVAERASDVHIETQENQVIIRFRIDGILRDIIKLPRGSEIALIARIKILSNLKIDEHRIPQDGRYKFNIDEQVIALRISIIPGFYGENVVMRILYESARPLSLEELGLTGKNLELLRSNITKPHGMILVTGPTGSGKTTTLYSILNILNTIKVKICTIEDPIEYGIPRVTQIQVNPSLGLDFATGLRALVRHDPDIIMVGEIRDKETAEIAIHSALTGHLVLSTIHTNDAAGTIPRLLDMGVEDYLIASTVNLIIAQRLVRRICSSCLTEETPNQNIVNRFKKDLNLDLSKQKFYRGKGCERCNMSGYLGRIGIYETMQISNSIRNIIVQKVTSDLIQKKAIEEGMITMLQDGINKVSAGLTTIEEVLRVVQEE